MTAARIAVYDEQSGNWLLAEGVTKEDGATIDWWADGTEPMSEELRNRPDLDNHGGRLRLIRVEIMASRIWMVDADTMRQHIEIGDKEIEG